MPPVWLESIKTLLLVIDDLERQIAPIERELRPLAHANEQVRLLNTAIETFPSNVLARLAGFTPREFFDIDDEARGPVDVSFQGS